MRPGLLNNFSSESVSSTGCTSNGRCELKDLDKPLVLKRGDQVTIVYDEPGLQVTAKGQANADGGVGDTMAVVNVSSKKLKSPSRRSVPAQ